MKPLSKKLKLWLFVVLVALALVFVWQVYGPKDLGPENEVFYEAKSGAGADEIAKELKEKGVINSTLFFRLYVFISGNYSKLQAGLYNFSSSNSIASIIGRLSRGDIATNKIRVIEGWDLYDIGKYTDEKNVYNSSDFTAAAGKDYSKNFDFLKSKPKSLSLEGYIFPDTYKVPLIAPPEQFVKMALNNFGNKLTPELRKKIETDKRTIFQVVIIASILEKEVPSLEDKKIVAGILWKRLANGMALQVDSTVNYATGKSDAKVSIKDTKVDSLYNTYKYKGLPLGPISNPGMDSLMAAIYPTKTAYWYYLSADGTGKTIYSKTYTDHKLAMGKYFK